MDLRSQNGNASGMQLQNRHFSDQEVVVPNRVFVGGLNETMNEDHLRQLFGIYGQIVEVLIKERGSSGGTRGFGFITFKTKAEAQSCLNQVQGEVLEIGGQKLNVRQATRRPPKTNNVRAKNEQLPVLPQIPALPPAMAPWTVPYPFPMPMPFGYFDQQWQNHPQQTPNMMYQPMMGLNQPPPVQFGLSMPPMIVNQTGTSVPFPYGHSFAPEAIVADTLPFTGTPVSSTQLHSNKEHEILPAFDRPAFTGLINKTRNPALEINDRPLSVSPDANALYPTPASGSPSTPITTRTFYYGNSKNKGKKSADVRPTNLVF